MKNDTNDPYMYVPLQNKRERDIAAEIDRRAAILTPILLMMLWGQAK